MIDETVIGFDSNVLTAFLLANNGRLSAHDRDPLAVERVATYRLFLYCSPSILPSVTVEAGLIPEGVKLEEHLRFIAYSFWQVTLDQQQKQLVEQRAANLEPYHSGALDCRIVAEAEVGKVPTFVTLDTRLIAHLSEHTHVRLRRPTEFWGDLAIPRGTRSKWVPGSGHPLEFESWWHW